MKLYVDLKEHGYPIYIEPGILGNLRERISQIFSGKKIMIISDNQVYSFYGDKVKCQLEQQYACYEIVVPHGEQSKSIDILPKLYRELLKSGLSRTDLIIALGGGVIGDLAGFVAATYLRGIRFVQIPTTILAQVDSSVGGKVAVDLTEGKNLVGAFYQPEMVLIDPEVLDTLPERYVIDGMGEVIKYGCIRDVRLFEELESYGSYKNLKSHITEVIASCVDIKRQIVERDVFDTGERLLLNFGHTLGHAIEQYHHYERESHGEGVAIGMYQITKLAEEAGLTKIGEAMRIRKVLEAYGLPVEAGIPIKKLKQAIQHDKKNLNDNLNIVLLSQIGAAYAHKTTVDFFPDDRNI